MDYLEGLRSILNEINVGSDQPPADNATEDSDDEDQNFMDDNGEDDASGGDDTTSTPEETTDDSEDDGDQNFMDDGGEGNTEEGSGDDTSEGDEGGEETSDSEGENSEESSEEESSDENKYDINKIENELFSSLTPEQIAIKNHELKNQFIELYSIIGSTLVRINDISKTNDNINVLKFITEKLLELREMIDFNITTAYQTRTYIENNIIYQQCIATLNAIAEIIDNIPKLDGRDESEEEESEEDKNGIPVDDEDEEETHTLNISDTTSGSTYQEESAFNSLF